MYAYSSYALPLFIAAATMALVAVYGWRHRTAHPAAPVFVALVLSVTVWLVAYGIEIMGTTPAVKEAWETLIIVTLAWLPFLWLVFAIQYSGQETWLTGRNLALLLLPALLTSLLTLTNSLHHLVWTAITVDKSGPFLATVPIRGPWFWVHTVFTYGYVLFGIGLFVAFFSRSAALFRRQGVIIVLSSLIPLAGNSLHVMGAVPVPGLDPGAYAFALSAGMLALGLFRYHMLDVVPIAHRVVLDHLHDGVIVLDPQGRIVEVNPAARQLLGLGHQDLVGKLASAVLESPELVARCQSPADEPQDIPIATDGKERWLQVSMLPLSSTRRQLAGRIVIVHDVTRERAAEQLRQDLTHVTVHDLRNPLNIVYASLMYLCELPEEAIAPSIQPYLDLAQRGCQRAIDLVNSILQISQLESGKVPLDLQRVAPGEMIAEVSQAMSLLASQGELGLVVEAAPDLPAIWVDPALVRRVLENLVGNAVKFTPPGGTVRVAVQPDGATLHIAIADTGPGISPQLERRLFQKFCAGPGDKRGSGLGLAFCKLAVDAHGGRIWIESKLCQGTCVHVTLPLYAGGEQAEAPRGAP